MTLNNDTVIQQCVEDLHDVPKIKYDFIQISQIAEKEPKSIVGTFSECVSVAEIQLAEHF